MVSQALGLEASDQVIDFVIAELREKNDFPLASYQPKFIIDQVRAACKFEGLSPQFRPDLITMALAISIPRTRRAMALAANADNRNNKRTQFVHAQSLSNATRGAVFVKMTEPSS